MTEAADTIAIIRDVAIITILLLAMLVLLVIFRKVSGVLDSARRTFRSAEEVTAALSSKIVGPAAAGSSVAFGFGKLAAVVLGWSSSRRRKGDKDDG